MGTLPAMPVHQCACNALRSQKGALDRSLNSYHDTFFPLGTKWAWTSTFSLVKQ